MDADKVASSRIAEATAIALTAVIVAASSHAEFTYSYVEVGGDVSRTENTADNPTDDADGRLFGINASWQWTDSLYTRVSYSTEDKTFSNLVVTTDLQLDTTQTYLTVGLGHVWQVGDSTDLYLEGMWADTEVEHDVPAIQPQMFGPPAVGTRVSVIADDGFGGAVGLRHGLGNAELEGRLTVIDIANEREDRLEFQAGWQFAENLTGYLTASYSKSTDRNFDNIVKGGVKLRLSQ